MSDWPLLGETVIRRTSVVLVFWALALMIASPIGGPAMLPAFPVGNIAIVLILAAFGYDTERGSLGVWPFWAPYAVLTLGAIVHRRGFFIWLAFLALMLAVNDVGCWAVAGMNLH
jgi:hypothetical protein